MAVLPLYLIAIPLRRSFAAAIELRFLVESTALYKSSRAGAAKSQGSTEFKKGGLGSQLKQFQFRQILRIDDSDRRAMIIHHHEIVDPMTLEQVEHFDC